MNYKLNIFNVIFAMILSHCTQILIPIKQKKILELKNNLELLQLKESKVQYGIPLQDIPILGINWQGVLRKFIKELLNIKYISKEKSIFIDEVKNENSEEVKIEKFKMDLCYSLKKNNIFNIITKKKINAARKNLHLSETDQLKFPGKSIGLARYLGAYYILSAEVKEDIKKTLLIKLTLILVQTGEIIWCSTASIEKN